MDNKGTKQGSIPILKAEKNSGFPTWAILERKLIESMNQAAREFIDTYTRADGTFIWRKEWPGMDGSDDGYESFYNFPLFYALGGSEDVYKLARKEWEAVTWQWTQYGQIYREFDGYYDWMHHGESSLCFYYFGLANPSVLKDQQRVRRFASFYTGEDQEACNYDPQKCLIRSPINGSKGPRFEMTEEDWCTHREVLDNYLPPFADIPGVPMGSTCPWSNDKVYSIIIKKINGRMAKGDVPLNLNATSLLTHAYMYTQKEKYKNWVLNYIEAWQDRTDRNNGIIPDNVGLSDVIGENMEGKWWGGYYGWRWPHGFMTIIEPVIIACSNATLLTGNDSYMDFARSQLDMIQNKGKDVEGEWLIPYKHFNDGWGDYKPMNLSWPLHCWNITHKQQDLQRVLQLDKKTKQENMEKSILIGERKRTNWQNWFYYINGQKPSYPEQILQETCKKVNEKIKKIRADDKEPEEYGIHHWQDKNPVITEPLVSLTMGAPQNIYHGGLLQANIRYYDGQNKRPGLPESVSALVEEVHKDYLILNLVNLNIYRKRKVIVQAGCFNEHTFNQVQVINENKRDLEINGNWFCVEMEPGSEIKLKIEINRLVNSPNYETPWLTKEDYPDVLVKRSLEK